MCKQKLLYGLFTTHSLTSDKLKYIIYPITYALKK